MSENETNSNENAGGVYLTSTTGTGNWVHMPGVTAPGTTGTGNWVHMPGVTAPGATGTGNWVHMPGVTAPGAIKTGARHSRADNDVLKRMRGRVRDMAKDLDEVGAPDLDPDPAPGMEAQGQPGVGAGQIVDAKTADETVVAFGGAVKALGDGRVGGYLVLFGDASKTDLEGDYFDPETDFGDAESTDVYYHHGLDKTLGPRVLGKATLKRDDVGVWMEAQLAMRDRYEKAVYRLAEAGKLGLSSGTAAHLVVREQAGPKCARIKKWPLGLDGSLTPTPAEPRTFAVPLKSLKATTELVAVDESQSGGSTASGEAAALAEVETKSTNQQQGQTKMEQNEILALIEKREQEQAAKAKAEAEAKAKQEAEIKAAVEAEKAKWEAEIKASRKGGYAVGDAPAIKRVTKRGFADEDMAVLRHWVRTGDAVAAKAAMQEDTDTEGGFLVPDGFYATITEKLREKSVVRAAGATVIPTSLKMTEFPVENASSAAAQTAEEGAYNQGEPTFSVVQIVNYKATVAMRLSEELVADHQSNLDQFLTNQIVNGLAEWENLRFINGSGTGQPRGALTAATVGVTTASATAIAAGEIVSLVYSLGDRYADNAAMITRRATLGSIRGLASANQFLFNRTPQGEGDGGGDGGINTTEFLYGIPVYQTSQMPAVATAVKSVLLGDFTQYYITERQGLTVTRNPYLYQANGQVGIFASRRLGGAPILDEAFVRLLQA